MPFNFLLYRPPQTAQETRVKPLAWSDDWLVRNGKTRVDTEGEESQKGGEVCMRSMFAGVGIAGGGGGVG